MAKQTIVTITDDLDGSEDAESVLFGYAGRDYEIDLSAKNKAKLEKALASYLEAARKVSGAGRGGRPRSSGSSGVDLAAVRAWGAEHGYRVAPRGRISADVLTAYTAAHNGRS